MEVYAGKTVQACSVQVISIRILVGMCWIRVFVEYLYGTYYGKTDFWENTYGKFIKEK